MDIKGKLLEKSETTNVTASFKKREFVVEFAENPQYPEYVKFELIQDKCDLINDFEPGQEIEVHFNLKGRKWTDPKGEVKYFNSLQAWRILPVGAQAATGSSPSGEAPPPAEEPEWLSASSEDDDLPF
ncbi:MULTISPECIES: DUF3127 domain-containing protein [unclassified Imperialibacter]|uniref:DUF3127 domain-containing protein n=1 Tax=unclassified Imperialibacter TaxID=2629706 RepID=UPI00125366A2|nr:MULTISPECIES: DUF3127 domain-containing protein [unclassified Imperialibacter]CAD5256794.1 conserved hypothetical protein [Imperialibacter sp. 89]CAD5271785.1 conserved hypothetical protein [Imperialibacter sp. 75]VVT19088.1 conserved hypothetical protein [Imperialibacter sp. EC-SDR9]